MKRKILFCALFAISCGSSGGNKTVDGEAPAPAPDAGRDLGVPSEYAGLLCPAVEPCGGNPTGLWNFTGICVGGLAELMAAQGRSEDIDRCLANVRMDVSGSLELRPDGTYMTRGVSGSRLVLTYSDACLRSMGESCAGYDKCGAVDKSGNCDCVRDESGDGEPTSKTGRYEFGRNLLTITENQDSEYSSGSTACTMFVCESAMARTSIMDYCVQGDSLKLIEFGPDTGSARAYTVMTGTRAPGTSASPIAYVPPVDSPVKVPAPKTVNAETAADDFESCGGNIVGTWEISSVALDEYLETSLISWVRNMKADGDCAVAINVTDKGTAYFAPHTPNFRDTTGYCSFDESPTLTITYRSDCLAGKAKTCEDLDAAEKAAVPIGADAVSGCRLSPSGDCVCSETHHYSFPDAIYDTVANAFFTAKVDMTVDVVPATDRHDYCVEGDTLRLDTYNFRIGGVDGYVIVTAVRSKGPGTDAGISPDAAPDSLGIDVLPADLR